jgi:hypothetical protein
MRRKRLGERLREAFQRTKEPGTQSFVPAAKGGHVVSSGYTTVGGDIKNFMKTMYNVLRRKERD